MAEYVRRTRPPASHPYWTRLRDRANPPPVVWPVAVPGILGLLFGLYAGLMEPMSAGKAVKMAAAVAGAVAVLVFTFIILFAVFDRSRPWAGRTRWAEAAFIGFTISAFVFFLLVVALVPLLLWYALFSGLGPWRGMGGGLALGAGLGATFAFITCRQWKQRQKQWPRWERMRAPRGSREAATVPPASPPAEPAPAAGPEPDWPEPRPAAE